MKQNIILIAVITLLVGGIGGYVISEQNREVQMVETSTTQDVPAGMHMMPDGTMMGNPDESMSGMQGMSGMDHSMMMVSSEREFVTGMIPHHQEAVDTAREVLARGGSIPEVRILAEEIIVAQETEIALLKEWHKDWYGEVYVADDSYQPMMRELEGLNGAEIDRRFLEDMIPHHMGAIMMAQSVRPFITHQEITDMADAIMTTQTTEINLMRDLLTKI
jgi:uncharacterized protein (DUF305 family)